MPSSNCLKSITRTLENEELFNSSPGSSNYVHGISSSLAQKHGHKGDLRFLPYETACTILEKEFWFPFSGDDLPLSLSFQLFDFAYSSSPPTAIKFLQRELHVPDPGVFSRENLRKIQQLDLISLQQLPVKLIQARAAFQTTLPSWPAYGKDWSQRTIRNLTLYLRDINVY